MFVFLIYFSLHPYTEVKSLKLSNTPQIEIILQRTPLEDNFTHLSKIFLRTWNSHPCSRNGHLLAATLSVSLLIWETPSGNLSW